MSIKPERSEQDMRNKIAERILLASACAITILGAIVIFKDTSKSMDIFNITLPVFSSWVGTVLAFYYGRVNFESANDRVREMIDKLSPEERSTTPVGTIMRKLEDTTHITLTEAKGEAQTKLSEMRALLSGQVSRLPVISVTGAPRYIVHGSTINRYLAEGGSENDSLADLVAKLGDKAAMGARCGFAIVGPKDSIERAKTRMESSPACQDIFVTADGGEQQPLVGWISNVRLAKYLKS